MRGELIEAASDRLLVVLPPLAGVVVDEGALAEGVGGARGLRGECAAGGFWALLV